MSISTLIKLLIVAFFVWGVLYVYFHGRSRRIPLLRQFFNYSALFAPYNALMYIFSKQKSQPYYDRADFKEMDLIKENWQVIKEEGEKLFDEGYIRAAIGGNEAGFGSFFKRGWKRFYLTWNRDTLPSAESLCPRTLELVRQVPLIKSALFTRLPAHSHLNAHRDPFAGTLRYHLGLSTPNSEKCAIYVDEEPQAWYDGEDFIFDETYIHYVINDTDDYRLIFFCDLDRPLKQPMYTINQWVSNVLAALTQPQNIDGEQAGLANRAYRGFINFSKLFSTPIKALKRKSRTAYNLLRAVAIIVIVLLILKWIF